MLLLRTAYFDAARAVLYGREVLRRTLCFSMQTPYAPVG